MCDDGNSENDSIGNENEISIDDEHNRVITHQSEISIMYKDQILNRGINDENSLSISISALYLALVFSYFI
ncbi:MAG: hypothetical protein GY755_08500 [Chloroflexi bacterium]|nr:hypothetical protein [Chloroflexota bacterium]